MNKKYTEDVFKLANLSKQIIAVPFALSFRYCNNNCNFCYLQPNMKNKPLTLQECQTLADNCLSWLKENKTKFPQDVSLLIELIGGELFIMDENYYKIYNNLLTQVKTITDEQNIKFYADFISNLLLNQEQLNRFLKLYKDVTEVGIDLEIVSSFDLDFRFKTKEHLDLWYSNLLKVSDTIKDNITIEVILSKFNIEKYLNKPDSAESIILDKLLSNPDKFTIIFNEYVPNKSINIQYVPTNELLITFYKTLIDKYWDKINEIDALRFFNSKNFKKSNSTSYPSIAYKGECCGPAFGLPNTQFDVPIDLKEYGIYNLYCAEIGLVAPWGKNQHKNACKQLYKIPVPENEWMCLTHANQINHYFNNILGCGNCKFKDICFTSKQQECYITHQFIWKQDICWKRPIFEYVDQHKI